MQQRQIVVLLAICNRLGGSQAGGQMAIKEVKKYLNKEPQQLAALQHNNNHNNNNEK